MKSYLLLVIFTVLLTGCDFQKHADHTFGDQHFKTAISLIELHKIRFGEYPESLNELKYTGEWDQMAINSVKYAKVEDGYTLTIVHGWIGKPELAYPAEFWRGLGIKTMK